MVKRVCFFIGHRDAPDSLMPLLIETVERHITEYGVADFYVGGFGRFDTLASKAVQAAKKRHPAVTLTRLLPYHPFDRPIPTPEGFDGTFYPPGMEYVPKRAAIVRANRYMVDNSDFLIAYVAHPSGGSRKILDWALKRQRRGLIHVTNLTGWCS